MFWKLGTLKNYVLSWKNILTFELHFVIPRFARRTWVKRNSILDIIEVSEV